MTVLVIGHLTGTDMGRTVRPRVAGLRSEGLIRVAFLTGDRTGPILVLNEGYDMVDVMVRVEPIRRKWAEALAEGDAVFAERFEIQVEAGWSGFPETLPILLQAATSGVPGEWDRSCSSTMTARWSATEAGRAARSRGRPSWGTRWRPPGSGEGSPPQSYGN
jgi:hypothetical protein